MALNGGAGGIQIFPQLGVKRPCLSRIRMAQIDPQRISAACILAAAKAKGPFQTGTTATAHYDMIRPALSMVATRGGTARGPADERVSPER